MCKGMWEGRNGLGSLVNGEKFVAARAGPGCLHEGLGAAAAG